MASYSPAKRATAWVGYISLVSQADTKLLKSSATIAAGDFKVSKDGGALANLTTLPAVTPAASVWIKIDLSATEMTADNVSVQCIDAAGAEWCDFSFNLQPSARQIDDLAYPATSGRSMVVDANGLVDATVVKVGPTGSGTAQTARDIGASVLLSAGTGTGQLDFTSGVVKANATQWLGGTIPAVNVTGVPLVDAKYLLGTIFSTPTVAGIPNVNAKTWNDLATVALPLIPTTAGRTLDVSATGEAGVDWANVGAPTTTLALTGTTIATTQKVDVETIKTNPVVNAGTITFPTTATLASTTNITAGTITTVGTLTTYTGNTPQTGDSFARIGVAGAGLTNIDLPNQTMDIVGNITGNLSGSVGSVTGLTASNLDATISSRASAANLATANTNISALITTVGVAGAGLSAVVWNAAWDAEVQSEAADALIATSLTESYRAVTAAGTLPQLAYEILALLGEKAVSGVTLTTKKVDQSTTAATYTLDSATAPTSITRAT